MNKICLTVLICSFMGCEKKNEIVDLDKEEITRSQQKSTHIDMRDVEKKPSIVREKSDLEQHDSLVRIAYKAIVGKVNIPEGVEPKVEVLGNICPATIINPLSDN